MELSTFSILHLGFKAKDAFEEARTEIALRSCINVKPRTQEKDYISVQSLNG